MSLLVGLCADRNGRRRGRSRRCCRRRRALCVRTRVCVGGCGGCRRRGVQRCCRPQICGKFRVDRIHLQVVDQIPISIGCNGKVFRGFPFVVDNELESVRTGRKRDQSREIGRAVALSESAWSMQGMSTGDDSLCLSEFDLDLPAVRERSRHVDFFRTFLDSTFPLLLTVLILPLDQGRHTFFARTEIDSGGDQVLRYRRGRNRKEGDRDRRNGSVEESRREEDGRGRHLSSRRRGL